MSLAVKCPRILLSTCRVLPRYTPCLELSTATPHHTEQWEQTHRGCIIWGVAGLAGLATIYASSYKARAKMAEDDEEDDDEDEEEEEDELSAMSDLIEEEANEETDLTADADTPDRMDMWAAVQQKYLLLSETKRAEVEFRVVTQEEFARADALYESGKLTELEDLLIELNTVSPCNDQVLWRLARLKWVLGRGYSTYHAHKVFHLGHALACQATEINPDNGDAHRWIAVLSFYRAQKDGVKAGVRNLEAMKYHLDKALEINPDDSVALTLLGNWYFECAEMSYLTRKWCKVFAGVEAPHGSYKKALALFKKSDSVEKWIHNTYWIAKTLLRMGRREEALQIFKELSQTVIVSGEDFRMKKEAHIHIDRLTNPGPVSKLLDSLIPGYLERWRIPLVWGDNWSTYNEDTNWNMVIGRAGPFDTKL